MKLIDLLVKKTEQDGWAWPGDALSVAQDGCGDCWGYDCENLRLSVGDRTWRSRSGSNIIAGSSFTLPELAGDWNTSFVTSAQYESALAKSDGWIEWGGGECPVKSDSIVDVRFRAGKEEKAMSAYHWHWKHDGSHSDIIAYRLHREINSRANDDRLKQDLNECIGQDVDMPEWSGEGLPPVGEKCVFFYDGPDWCWGDKLKNGDEVDIIAHFSARDDSQHCMVAAFTNKNNHHVQVYQAISGCFRPLRTEAEKKRDEAIEFIREIIDAKAGDPFNCARFIYECMMGGNIPGVKLENK